ncbi:MAG TPA: UbiA family prenyltransferase, partial [Pseudonocardiaceae bacterium]|nr:UbiA family prenyltransferase [Pseudonocardiaceae bacterium]
MTATTQQDSLVRRTNPVAGLVRTMRPRQWLKNVLVLAAPFAGGYLFQLPVLIAVGVAFVAFSLAASGVYLVNDVQDVQADRAHPTKRNRPIAAGIVAPQLALAVAVLLFATAIAVSFLASADLALVTAVYIAVQISYCLWLKHQP